MTWEEKFYALKALVNFGDAALMMRKPGDWYVSLRGVDRKEGCVLAGCGGHSGKTPEEAVELAFSYATDERYYVVSDAVYPDRRKAFRWNGFMWDEVSEDSTGGTK